MCAVNLGINPNTLSGSLGSVVFYTANGQSLIRTKSKAIKKSTSVSYLNSQNRFSKASKFTNLLRFFIPTFYSFKIPPKNRYSTCLGQFINMLDNNLIFEPHINNTFSFGNGFTPVVSIRNLINSNNGTFQLDNYYTDIPIEFDAAQTYINAFVFNDTLTKILYLPAVKMFNDGPNSFDVKPTFHAGDNVIIFFQLSYFDGANTLYTPLVGLYPLEKYSW